MTADALATTRGQRLMRQALAHVTAVQAYDQQRGADKQLARAYGGWCHRIPILVLTNGLCQTVAFLEDKASGQESPGGYQKEACRLVRAHLAQVLGIDHADRLAQKVSEAPLPAYMHQTRLILNAWVYYKRFAVSLLGVEVGDVDTEGSA